MQTSRYWKDTYWAIQKSLTPKIPGGGGGGGGGFDTWPMDYFLQHLTLTTFWMSFLITSPRKSAPSENLSSSKPSCLPCYLFRWKSLANFWVCCWWICLKDNQQCICQVLWTRSHSHHASLWKPWHSLADHHEHHQHISYQWHCTTWSSKPLLKKAITWQKSSEKLPPHF